MTVPVRIGVAFAADALDASPTFTWLDTITGVRVADVSVQRGRTYLTDQTQAGSASAEFFDQAGALDPTNILSSYLVDANLPIVVELRNPFSGSDVRIFRGTTQGIPTTMRHERAEVNHGTIPALDLFAALAVAELPPATDFAAQTPGSYTASTSSNVSGDTVLAVQNVDDRIRALLADYGLPSAMTIIFSGNTTLHTTPYSPGSTYLQALQEAADGEFPFVANHFIDKDGLYRFLGRLSRFHPEDYGTYVHVWQVGDAPVVALNSAYALLAADDFIVDRDPLKIVNSALFSPRGATPAQIAAQLRTDAASIAKYGPHSISGQDLLTNSGLLTGLGTLEECQLFGDFYVSNLKDPVNAITQATFRSRRVDAANAEAHWNLLCNVEIGDIIRITTSHPGGGGFIEEDFFVEGIRYEIRPLTPLMADVTLTLDLSPGAFFDIGPWSGDPS